MNKTILTVAGSIGILVACLLVTTRGCSNRSDNIANVPPPESESADLKRSQDTQSQSSAPIAEPEGGFGDLNRVEQLLPNLKGKRGFETLLEFFGDWARRDPVAAWEYAIENKDELTRFARPQVITHISEVLSKDGRQEEIVMLWASVESTQDQLLVFKDAGRFFKKEHYSMLLSAIDAKSDMNGMAKRFTYNTLGASLADDSYEGAIAWVRTLANDPEMQSEAFGGIIKKVVDYDGPTEALDLIAANVDAVDVDRSMGYVLRELRDAETVAKLAGTIEDPKPRDNAWKNAAYLAMSESMPQAIQYASKISDQQSYVDVVSSLYRRRARSSKQEALDYLSNDPRLTQPQKEYLKTQLGL